MQQFCQSEELYLEESNIKHNYEGRSQEGIRKTVYTDEKWGFIKDRNDNTGYKLGGLLTHFEVTG